MEKYGCRQVHLYHGLNTLSDIRSRTKDNLDYPYSFGSSCDSKSISPSIASAHVFYVVSDVVLNFDYEDILYLISQEYFLRLFSLFLKIFKNYSISQHTNFNVCLLFNGFNEKKRVYFFRKENAKFPPIYVTNSPRYDSKNQPLPQQFCFVFSVIFNYTGRLIISCFASSISDR